jgi:virulence factor Mce-like protein
MSTRAILAAVLAVGAVAATVLLSSSGGDGYRVRVELPNAAGLRPGSLVKVGGVSVGSVNSIKVTPRDTALATLALKPSATPVGPDARIAIRPANLLGEKFVDFDVGDRSRPLDSGATLPKQRTHTVVELDQVLDVLDPATRARLGLLMRESGLALTGRGRDLGDALRALPTSLYDARRLLAEVGADNAKLDGMLVHTDRVVDAVTRERRHLGNLVNQASTLLQTTAQRRRELATTLRESPATLAQLRTTLRRLDSASTALRPAAAGLRATAPSLTATLRALPGFAAAAEPTLAKARAVAPTLATLGRRASPVLRRLRPTATTLAATATDSDALTASLDRAAANALGTIEGWARAVSLRDDLGHVFRVSADVSADALKALKLHVIAGRRDKSSRPKPLLPQPKTPSRPRPQLPRPVLPKTPSLPGQLQPRVDQVIDDVTGLLDYLLEP